MIKDKLFKLFLVIKTIRNFPTAFLDILSLLRGEVLYNIRGKNIMFYSRANTEDIAEIVMVASGREYALSNIASLPKRPVIVDVGGHIGTFSISIAKILKNKCRVITFEPDKENYDLLLKNIKLNKVNSVSPKNIAISDYVGKGYLHTEKMNTDAYFLDQSRKGYNCQVSTLVGEMGLKRIKKINILKMDIEGGEYKIFSDKKSLNYILKNVHYFFLEYHNIDRINNYARIQRIIEDNFRVLDKHGVTLLLENLHWEGKK